MAIRRAGRAEGVRHVANQVACWLTYAIGHSDPAHPAFFRSSDPVYPWGGPNVDQVARRARSRATARIACRVTWDRARSSCSRSSGARPERRRRHRRPRCTRRRSDSVPATTSSCVLGGRRATGPWFALGPDADVRARARLLLRLAAAEPATFVIERLDTQGRPRRRSPPSGSRRCSTTPRTESRALGRLLQRVPGADAPAREPNTFSDAGRRRARACSDIHLQPRRSSRDRRRGARRQIDPRRVDVGRQLYTPRGTSRSTSRPGCTSRNHRQVGPTPTEGAHRRRRTRPGHGELARHRGSRRRAGHRPLVPAAVHTADRRRGDHVGDTRPAPAARSSAGGHRVRVPGSSRTVGARGLAIPDLTRCARRDSAS